MKKAFLLIFLSFLFTGLFVNAGTSSIPSKANPVFKSCKKTNSPVFNDFGFDAAEIESVVAYSFTSLKNNQGYQRLGDFHAADFKLASESIHGCNENDCTLVELFGNNYLSHNYPSHNLW